jgi:L-threonylcarbamoyladenylate synthase
MKTELLSSNNPEDILKAVSLLKNGHLVALPTETVYGLAADATNESALYKIFEAKDRPIGHPLIVHIASINDLQNWAINIPSIAFTLAKNFWPGPLTLLLNSSPDVSKVITGGLKTIAIRIPNNPIFLQILRALGQGIAAPSANPHKRLSPTSASHVMDNIGGKIAAVIDDGPCIIGLESTIIDLTSSQPKILRPGPITASQLEEATGISIAPIQQHNEKVSGNMLTHYQPKTLAIMMTIKDIEKYITEQNNTNKHIGIIHLSFLETANADNIYKKLLSIDKALYAKSIYDTLHDLDKKNLDLILIEELPKEEEWTDVSDRLKKATTY